MKPSDQSDVVRRFIEEAGHLTQSLGLGRVIGQLFAFLYFSPDPRSLEAMQEGIGISKGSASMAVRQLEQWGAVRKVWVKGDRKDYYEANDWLGQIVRNVLMDTIGKRLSQTNGLLAVEPGEVSLSGNGDDAFVRERIANLARFQERVRRVWSNVVVQKLLK